VTYEFASPTNYFWFDSNKRAVVYVGCSKVFYEFDGDLLLLHMLLRARGARRRAFRGNPSF
jgi:hypothetical protein